MPTNTYTPLGAVTLAADTDVITFAAPSGYKDLVLVGNFGSTHGSEDFIFGRLNGDTASNYSDVWMRGTGSAAQSSASTQSSFLAGGIGVSGTAIESVIILQFADYSATDKHKTILTRLSTASLSTWAVASRWASTSAITSITLDLSSGNFRSGSTFNLWGIV